MSKLVYRVLMGLMFLTTVHHQVVVAAQIPSDSSFNNILNLINDYRKSTVFLGLGIGSALAYTAYKTKSPFVRYTAAFSLMPLLGVPLWAAYLKRGAVAKRDVQNVIKDYVGVVVPQEQKKDAHLDLFGKLVEKSNWFNENIAQFHTSSNRMEKIAGNNVGKKNIIGYQALNVWPIAHAKVIALIEQFVQYKADYGSDVEKKFYKEHMIGQNGAVDVPKFITRLLTKRPIVFFTKHDSYLLPDKTRGTGGFELIGTDQEKKPLILEDYISYDEMPIAALIGVSVPTYFINDGDRSNKANVNHNALFQEQGVYTGLVGARFEKIDPPDQKNYKYNPHDNQMETRHMVITKGQNTPGNGYGSINGSNRLLNIWQNFYQETFPTHEQAAINPSRYVQLDFNRYLDKEVYKKRIKFIIGPFLLDANERAKNTSTSAYCRIVGLGLGVWMLDPVQEELYVEACKEVIEENILNNVSNIDFNWMGDTVPMVKKKAIQDVAKSKCILVNFNKNNPARQLVGEDSKKLLVATYAWDGNAFPGNEYWFNMLTASGDPAAACCSTIAELQNPLINDHVSGEHIKWYGADKASQQSGPVEK